MRQTRLLVLDLDGTLLGDPVATRRFQSVMADLEPTCWLAYVTGRSLADTRDVLATGFVPKPDFMAPFTGSALYDGADGQPDLIWQRQLEDGWSAEQVRSVASCLPMVEMQAPIAQHPLRSSFRVLDADVGQVAESLRAALDAQGVTARVVANSGQEIDVVPRHAGKGGVVRRLMRRLGLPAWQVAVFGNDGNDLDMLAIDCAATAVGNMASSWRSALHPHVYQAREPFADGIIEGLQYWGWLPAGLPR